MINTASRAALFALLISITAPALAAAERFTVMFGERAVGTLVADTKSGEIRIVYDYKNNGRGPTMAETIRVDRKGLPTAWTISGTTTFGSKVAESFSSDGRTANWTDSTGKGNARLEVPAIYVAQSASPWALGLYARALSNSGGPLPALPGGELKLERIAALEIAGKDGKLPVTAWSISGIDISRPTLFLDRAKKLVAVASSSFIVVREGFEGEETRLRNLVAQWDTERLAGYQKALANRPAGPLRIRNVRVFQPATLSLSEPASVIVRGNRIMAIEPAATAAAEGETVIEGNGGTLIPGLFEMHAHLGQESALLNIAAGITTVRDMGNNDPVLDKLVQRLDAGELAGPRVIRSAFIEGKSATSAQGGGAVVDNLADALEAVRDGARRGVFQIKIYSSINPEWVPAMVAEAKTSGLRVAGHIPAFTTTDAMLEAGYDEITHSNQLMLNWVLQPGDDTRTLLRITALKRFHTFDLDAPAPRKTLDLMVAKKAAHDPTLVIMETATLGRTGQFPPSAAGWGPHMPIGMQRSLKQAMLDVSTPEDDVAYRGSFDTTLEVMQRLHKAGVMIVPGTDMGGHFWYHRELELFTRAGMTNGEVLKRATADMADYLGLSGRFGRIAPGMTADLVLLEGDPMADITETRKAAMVVKDGAVYFPADIHEKLGIKPFAARPAVSGTPFAKN